MIEEILKNIYRVPVALPKSPLRCTNDYVIKGGDRDILIDTAFDLPECREALFAALKELNVAPERTDLLLTHCHGDHAGLSPALGMRGAAVHLARDEQCWIADEDRLAHTKMNGERLVREGFDPKLVEECIILPTVMGVSREAARESCRTISEGDVFHCGDYALRAVETPGHSPQHMCFYMEDSKTMFLGDSVLFDITPNVTLWNFVEDSLGDYLNSLDKLDGMDVELALPGHRDSGDMHRRIAELKEHHQRRLSECLDIVCREPDMTAYDVAGKMHWQIRCSGWDDFPRSQKWFAVGEAHAHLRRLARLGEIIEDDSERQLRFRPR